MGVLNFQNDRLTGERKLVESLLLANDQSDFLVVDVGANVGEFAEIVLSQTKFIKIISFEPNPVSFEQLVKRVASDNDRAEVINLAVSDGQSQEGELIVDDSRSYGGFSTFTRKVHCEMYPHIRRVKVSITSLDQFFQNHTEGKIALLKIDVEGHEKKVLMGAQSFINSMKPLAILFEFNDIHIHSGTSLTDLIALIGNRYEFFRLLPNGKLYPLEGKQTWFLEIYAFQNIVCLLK
jgi:FkbM family methyltransferase